MTNAFRIRTRIESETLHLPELRPLIGKEVEIVVQETGASHPAAATPGQGPKAEATAAANGDGPRTPADDAAWRSRYDAMLADALRAQRQRPDGYVADDSRDGIYEGRGE